MIPTFKSKSMDEINLQITISDLIQTLQHNGTYLTVEELKGVNKDEELHGVWEKNISEWEASRFNDTTISKDKIQFMESNMALKLNCTQFLNTGKPKNIPTHWKNQLRIRY